jgi:L-fucose isomerase-like protein
MIAWLLQAVAAVKDGQPESAVQVADFPAATERPAGSQEHTAKAELNLQEVSADFTQVTVSLQVPVVLVMAVMQVLRIRTVPVVLAAADIMAAVADMFLQAAADPVIFHFREVQTQQPLQE